MYRAVLTLLTVTCLVFGSTDARNTSFALDSSSNGASMDTISCERNRLLLSQRRWWFAKSVPEACTLSDSQFEIEDNVKIFIKESFSAASEQYRGRYLSHLKRNLKKFSLVYRKDGRFHGIIDLKHSYDLAHTKVAYKCDAPTEQIEASILLFQSQKTASNSEPTSEGRIKALEAELAEIKSGALQTKFEQATDTAANTTSAFTSGPEGNVSDSVVVGNVSELLIDDEPVSLDGDENFSCKYASLSYPNAKLVHAGA